MLTIMVFTEQLEKFEGKTRMSSLCLQVLFDVRCVLGSVSRASQYRLDLG